MRDADILGSLGESEFKTLCLSADLIPNESLIDKTGWDFIVEFPFIPNKKENLDQQKAAIECKFQIKSTDNQTKKIQIKLSNLQRFIKIPLPTFVVVFEFDGHDKPERGYLLHVENELITRVLRRLRIADVKGRSVKLHKETITINYSCAEEIYPLNGRKLKELIRTSIGVDTEKYVKKKIEFLGKAGYDDGYGTASYTILEEDYKKMIDVSLGLEKEIDIKNFSFTDTRFGISSKKPQFDFTEMTLSMPVKPTRKGKLIFKKEKFSKGLSFPIKVYISPLNKFVESDSEKIRIKAEYFDFVFNPNSGAGTITLSLRENTKLKLIKLEKLSRLFTLFSNKSKRIIVEHHFKGFPMREGSMQQQSLATFIDKAGSKTIKNAIFLADYFGLYNPKVSYFSLVSNSQNINQLSEILQKDVGKFEAKFTLELEQSDIPEKVVILAPIYSIIGYYRIVVIIAFIGKAVPIEGKVYSLKLENMENEHSIIVDCRTDNSEDYKNNLLNRAESITEKYGKNGVYVMEFGLLSE